MTSGLIGLLLMFVGCTNRDTIVDKSQMLGYDYRLFQGTPAWDLAKAVEDEDIELIGRIVSKNKALLNATEPRFGQTLLQLAVMTLKYESTKALVSLGANPNTQDKCDGSSPLMEAAHILLLANKLDDYGSNPKFLKLLLEHGGDPNTEENGPRRQGNATRHTPLMIACGTGYLDYVKLLVEAGAKVNYKNEYDETAIGSAVMFSRNPEMVIYLIQKGADYKRPIMKRMDGKELYITDLMRDWRFELNSEQYKKKMELADFLKKNGMDYRKTEIPQQYLGDYPKAYLEKY